MKLYLSGPMRGLPGDNRALFNAAALEIRSKGYDVFNPAEADEKTPTLPREERLRRDVAAVTDCEGIAFLPGWQGSAGTRLELTIAKALNLKLFRWDPDAKVLLPMEMDDINRPAHYTLNGIEVIDAIEAWRLDYHLGTVVKYIARAQYKGNELEDLEKALWFLKRRIELKKKEEYERSNATKAA